MNGKATHHLLSFGKANCSDVYESPTESGRPTLTYVIHICHVLHHCKLYQNLQILQSWEKESGGSTLLWTSLSVCPRRLQTAVVGGTLLPPWSLTAPPETLLLKSPLILCSPLFLYNAQLNPSGLIHTTYAPKYCNRQIYLPHLLFIYAIDAADVFPSCGTDSVEAHRGS